MKTPGSPPRPADPARAAAAVRELRGTPERVAAAFADELLAGYRSEPSELLSDALPSRERGMVALTDLRYTAVCPHHLIPSWGRCHLGYLPGGRIVGVGVLASVVEALSRRLVLQETLGQRIADALVEHLGALAAGVVLEGRHGCLSARGEREDEARVITQSFAGRWSDDVAARAEFLHAVSGAAGVTA